MTKTNPFQHVIRIDLNPAHIELHRTDLIRDPRRRRRRRRRQPDDVMCDPCPGRVFPILLLVLLLLLKLRLGVFFFGSDTFHDFELTRQEFLRVQRFDFEESSSSSWALPFAAAAAAIRMRG